MGSKRLKAVAITTQRNIELFDKERFGELVKEQTGLLKSNKGFDHFSQSGTTGGAISRNSIGVFPVRNFRSGQLVDYEKLSDSEYRKWRIGHDGCYGCPIRCGQKHVVTSGPYAGARSEGPEYESVWAFTGTVDSTNSGGYYCRRSAL